MRQSSSPAGTGGRACITQEQRQAAEVLAERLAERYGDAPDCLDVLTDGGTVTVTTIPITVAAWQEWRGILTGGQYLHATAMSVVVEGDVGGVPVRLVGYGVPDLLRQEAGR